MTTLYLHIGTPKTGTSYMQSFLRENNEQIKKQGYIYPEFPIVYEGIGRNRNGHFLVDTEDTNLTNYHQCTELLHKLAGEYPNIILSEEALWNNGEWLAKFVEDMKQVDIQVKILVYLRRQDLYMQSQWAQNIKEHMTKSFLEFLETANANLDYLAHLDELSEMVGAKNVLVRVYEKQQFEGESKTLCSDYLKTVGIQLTKDFKVADDVKNPSLSGIYLECKRMLNQNPKFATRHNFVIPYFYELMRENQEISAYTENEFFTYEEQMEFLARYERCNEAVARKYLNRTDGILFRDVIQKKEAEGETFCTDEYIDILGKVLLKQEGKIQKLRVQLQEFQTENRKMEQKILDLKKDNESLKEEKRKRFVNRVKRKVRKILAK